jgi:hypothetical protein
MAALQNLQELAFDFDADDVFRTVARRRTRHFHCHRKTRVGLAVGIVHAVDMGHATGMHAIVHGKAIDDRAWLQQFHRPRSRRSAKNSCRPTLRMAAAAPRWS